jgi:hypothetical protein
LSFLFYVSLDFFSTPFSLIMAWFPILCACVLARQQKKINSPPPKKKQFLGAGVVGAGARVSGDEAESER